MDPHNPFTEIGLLQPQGQQNPPVTVNGSLRRTEILQRIFPIPQDIFPHIDDQAVETVLVRNQAVEGVVELGVPIERLLRSDYV